jgi:hypothetical protein
MTLLATLLFLAAPAQPKPNEQPRPARTDTRSPQRVTADLEKACKKGNGAACAEAGNRYLFGVGTRPSQARASDLFRSACHHKNQDGCADEALDMAVGRGERTETEAGVTRLEKACKAGVAHACGNLGIIYERAIGRYLDTARAETLMSDACRKGDLTACKNVAGMYLADGDRKSFEKYARASCDYGDADGCATLADVFFRNHENVQATAVYADACGLGSVRGCTGQALLMLDAGADPKKALSLLDRSCNLGDGRACDAGRAYRDAAAGRNKDKAANGKAADRK